MPPAPERVLRVPSMCCAHEEKPIREALQGMDGVAALNIDLAGRTVAFRAVDKVWEDAIAAVNRLGFATEPPPKAEADDCCSSGSCGVPIAFVPSPRRKAQASGANPQAAQVTSPTAEPSVPLTAPPGALLLRIPEMDCPVEEGQIRRAMEAFPQVARLRFDLPARALTVEAPADAWDAVTADIRKLGFTPERISAAPAAEEIAKTQRAELVRLLAALGVAVVAEVFHLAFPDTLPWRAAGMGVAAIAIALSGLAVFKKGLSALVRGQLNINALMSVAVIGAFLIGQWPEAAMVMALYSLAELIEARSVERARNAIAGLLALSPPQSEVRQADGSWVLTDAKDIAVGAVARVKPGERFALDGRVTAGHGAVDQSPVTGESIPVDKGPGDEVFAGTINQSGALEFEVTKPASDTVLARIIHAVEEAQGQRAPTQRIVDRFAAVYTPAVFVLAMAIAVGMPLLAGWPWLEAIYKALVLLVIACPCALVISTPVTVVSGLAAAARRGILIKGGVYLEQARKLSVLGLDKTGTLTQGKPKLVATEVLVRDVPEEQVLRVARSLAGRSDHPVSKAVADGLDGAASQVQDFGAELGKGVQGNVDGRLYILGNHRWLHERGQCSAELEALMKQHEAQGRTLSVLANDQQALALFAVADTTKESSKQAIAELKALGVRPVMLTGDNATTAAAIAQQVGIEEVRANLLPADKQTVVAELRSGGRQVGMVGDGVNDSPSLAAAEVGFSMGAAGTDTAKEAADVLIMNDDLRKVPETIRLSKKTYAVLWQNIVLALGIKAVFFVLAVFGSATMWMAVFADMGASLLVVFNGLRLLRGVHRG
ncbi:heavy metal resistance membrane ATPase [Pseudorhodoferax aquiterrae]|uniref:P-type Zn(2+) transporter n=1 Tax=Pseudorhodoferax aquiterrae TaxID=747304 RepID=A0ABQ3G437_9BURK|nr:heavy metal resistance membrane ATPase [Pseudorhodoferax aquiterrae]